MYWQRRWADSTAPRDSFIDRSGRTPDERGGEGAVYTIRLEVEKSISLLPDFGEFPDGYAPLFHCVDIKSILRKNCEAIRNVIAMSLLMRLAVIPISVISIVRCAL